MATIVKKRHSAARFILGDVVTSRTPYDHTRRVPATCRGMDAELVFGDERHDARFFATEIALAELLTGGEIVKPIVGGILLENLPTPGDTQVPAGTPFIARAEPVSVPLSSYFWSLFGSSGWTRPQRRPVELPFALAFSLSIIALRPWGVVFGPCVESARIRPDGSVFHMPRPTSLWHRRRPPGVMRVGGPPPLVAPELLDAESDTFTDASGVFTTASLVASFLLGASDYVRKPRPEGGRFVDAWERFLNPKRHRALRALDAALATSPAARQTLDELIAACGEPAEPSDIKRMLASLLAPIVRQRREETGPINVSHEEPLAVAFAPLPIVRPEDVETSLRSIFPNGV